jgi:hypothetical protein
MRDSRFRFSGLAAVVLDFLWLEGLVRGATTTALTDSRLHNVSTTQVDIGEFAEIVGDSFASSNPVRNQALSPEAPRHQSLGGIACLEVHLGEDRARGHSKADDQSGRRIKLSAFAREKLPHKSRSFRKPRKCRFNVRRLDCA